MRRLLLLVLFASSLLAQDDPRAARVDALFAHYNAAPSPGLAIVVVRDGKVILRRAYGLANIEHRVPITTATVFDVASLSKQFTGFAVATLIAQGKIKLADDVRKYIPELHDFGHPITINHLVHHMSGLRDWPATLFVGGWRSEDVITNKQILTMAFNQRTLNFVPGAEHVYSNTEDVLLAEIVQRVTGRPFREWTAELIFKPLGMTRSHFRDDWTEVILNVASGYRRAADGTFHTTPDNLVALGSSSLFSTADDLALWLMSFDRPSDVQTLMHTPGALDDHTAVPYAFGILGGSWRGLPMYTSSGAWASFNTYDVYVPRQKFGIVVLANTTEATIDAQNAVIDIAKIYLENELAPETASALDDAAPIAETAPKPAVTHDLADYASEYDSKELGTSYRVTVNDGALELQHRRLGTIALKPTGGDAFTSQFPYFEDVRFERDADGRVTTLIVNAGERSRDIRFTRRCLRSTGRDGSR